MPEKVTLPTSQRGSVNFTVDSVEYHVNQAPKFVQIEVMKLTERVGTNFDTHGTPGSRVTKADYHRARQLAVKWGQLFS